MKNLIVIFLICSCFILKSKTLLGQCAACQYAVDLVNNGDFENGNSSFTTSLNYSPGPIFTCPLCTENTYAIGASAVLYHSGFSGTDHTNPPFGNFFIANGTFQSGSVVWCENTAVQPNTDYTFSFWARDVANNNNVHPYALLQASFNGELIADTLIASGGWQEYSVVWNSGSSTTLQLCIFDQQSNTGGNDFGIDDISLVGCNDYHLSQPAFAGDDLILCSNALTQLGVPSIPGYSYSWDNAVGLNSTSISNPDLTIQNNGGDAIVQTYIVTRDSASVGCISADTVVVSILPMAAFNLGNDIYVCPGDSAQLNAGSNWQTVFWSNNQTDSSIWVDPGVYTAQVTADNSCTASDEVSVLAIEMPAIDLGEDQIICASESIVLHAGVEGLWSNGSFSDTLAVSQSGEFYITYTNQNCQVSDSVNIMVLDYPDVYLPVDTLSCSGIPITLDAGIQGLWSTGAVGSSIVVAQSGYYDFVVKNGPCQTQTGTNVVMSPLPSVDLGPDITTCEDNTSILNAFDENNISYLWSTGDTTSTINANTAGAYTVTVTNECGTDSDEIILSTYPCTYALQVPSCFTPNDDNVNESWIVQGYNVSNVNIRVYNRFGDMIFYANDLGIPWYPSTGIKDDVYDYRIEAITFDGDNVLQLGHIYLVR